MPRTFALASALLIAGAAFAQNELDVLPAGDKDSSPRRMLYKHLQAEAQKHFDARRAAVAALKTPDDVRKRQAEIRAKFLDSLGAFPEKTPLNAKVLGALAGDGTYTVEKVVFESRPNHHVTAAFFRPVGKGPFPGVIVPCGHSDNGKAAEPYQRACILLAKNGVAALCYDPIGQGERRQLLTTDNKPVIKGTTSEHTMIGIGALLVGRQCAHYRIWDGIRALDYLASRSDIDPARLGCTGNSGGGTLTAYLMALDERIFAAAPSCYITSLERLFATIGPQDAEQNITGQVAFGMEHSDYVTLRAPRPTLICIGSQDYFDWQGAWTTYREAKLVYGILGHGERVDLFEFNDKHGFSLPRRQAAMRWMRRWLLKTDDAPEETNFPSLKDEQLQVTKTGQVLADFHGLSAYDLNRLRAAELASARKALPKEELLREVRRLIALPPTVKSIPVQRNDRGLTFTTEGAVQIPAVRSVAGAGKDGILLSIHESGKSAALAEFKKLGTGDFLALFPDLRGVGETAPGVANAGSNVFGVEQKEAFLSLQLGRPLLGQRTHDLLCVLNALFENPDDPRRPVHLHAVGSMGPIALHAAALDARFAALTLKGSIASWASVVAADSTTNQLANAIPGALAVYDLPDLAASLAPRKLNVINPVDPSGKPLTREAAEREFAKVRAAYKAAGAEKNFVLEIAP